MFYVPYDYTISVSEILKKDYPKLSDDDLWFVSGWVASEVFMEGYVCASEVPDDELKKMINGAMQLL